MMANVTILKPKTRDEWLEVRKFGIGSSEVGTILGVNPFETPYQLWRRKRGLDAPKAENDAMMAGHVLEPAVAQWWQEHTGNEVIKSSAGDWIMRDNDRPFLQVSPDRTYWLGKSRNQSEKGILEIKTTRKVITPDELPMHWFCQLTYQLGVAGYKEGSLAWLSSSNGFDFGTCRVEFNADFYNELIEEIERFWLDCVVGGKEPEPTNVADVMLKYPKQVAGLLAQCDEPTMDIYHELRDVRDEMSALSKRKDELEDKIKMAIADAEGLAYGDAMLATWKAPKPAMKFNEKAFIAEHPDLAKQYFTEVQGSRRFILK